MLTRAILLITLSFSSLVALADHGDNSFAAVPEDTLKLQLIPMTEPELALLATQWQQALKDKASEVVATELQIRHNTDVLDDSGTAQKVEAAITEHKKHLITDITELRLQQHAISERFGIVLQAWQSKGGEPGTFEQYRLALEGVTIDVNDTSGTWLYIWNWVQSEDGGIYWILRIVKTLFLFCLFFLAYRLLAKMTDSAVSHSHVSTLMGTFIQKMVRRSLIFFGLLLLLSALEVNIAPILAIIGAAGLVIGLALQNTLSNFASGLLILIYRPFDLEDFIEVSGVSGVVDEMTLLSTRIKTFDHKFLTIPNNSIWEGVITNYTESKVRRVDLIFGIAYSDDFNKAKDIINKVLEDHPNVLKTPKPVVRITSLGDSSVNITCYPWVKTENYWAVHWDLHEHVKTAFDAQGISIPFPQRDVHIIKE